MCLSVTIHYTFLIYFFLNYFYRRIKKRCWIKGKKRGKRYAKLSRVSQLCNRIEQFLFFQKNNNQLPNTSTMCIDYRACVVLDTVIFEVSGFIGLDAIEKVILVINDRKPLKN